MLFDGVFQARWLVVVLERIKWKGREQNIFCPGLDSPLPFGVVGGIHPLHGACFVGVGDGGLGLPALFKMLCATDANLKSIVAKE